MAGGRAVSRKKTPLAHELRMELAEELGDLFTDFSAVGMRIPIWETVGDEERLTEQAQEIFDRYYTSIGNIIEDVLGTETQREELGFESREVRTLPHGVTRKLIDAVVEFFKKEAKGWHVRKRWGLDPRRRIEEAVYNVIG